MSILKPPEYVELLRQAFPSVQGRHICAWCRDNRQRNHALCRECWQHRLTQTERDRYWSMGLQARATWIVENKPSPMTVVHSDELVTEG